MRRDEIYYRITPRQLYELYMEYERDEYESINDNTPLSKYGGSPKIVTHSEYAEPLNNKPYLILDIRDHLEYNKNHLMQARSFPLAYLRRDQLHSEVYKFKNDKEALIIVYCDDERISKEAAKILVDRGIDNMYLLSGGLNEFSMDYADYIEGDLPVIKTPPKTSRFKKTMLASLPEDAPIGGGAGGATLTMYRSPRKSNLSKLTTPRSYRSPDSKSESGSMMSNFSVAESVISRAQSRKGKF